MKCISGSSAKGRGLARTKRRPPPITALIQQVIAHPVEMAAWRAAVEQLAMHGDDAVLPVLRAMHGPVPPGQHARDMVEYLGAVLGAIARRDPAPLIRVLDRDAVQPDPQLAFVVGALGEAPKRQALPALVRALKHRDPVVRWSAAEALIQLRSKKAIGPLVEALRDRSPMVKHAIVQTMYDREFFRTPAAIEPLRRIVANKRMKRESPGTWRMAGELVARLGG